MEQRTKDLILFWVLLIGVTVSLVAQFGGNGVEMTYMDGVRLTVIIAFGMITQKLWKIY